MIGLLAAGSVEVRNLRAPAGWDALYWIFVVAVWCCHSCPLVSEGPYKRLSSPNPPGP